jgi:hypothetical protein
MIYYEATLKHNKATTRKPSNREIQELNILDAVLTSSLRKPQKKQTNDSSSNGIKTNKFPNQETNI